MPSLGIVAGALLPLLVFGQREERFRLLTLRALHDRGDELLQEAGHIEQGRPEVMNEVDDETLDVTAVVILIGHDHDVSVTQRLDVLLCVRGVEFQSHDLDEVHDLLVLHDLRVRRVAHVEELALQREDPVVVASDDREAGYGEGPVEQKREVLS